jgi:hypothetical protein
VTAQELVHRRQLATDPGRPEPGLVDLTLSVVKGRLGLLDFAGRRLSAIQGRLHPPVVLDHKLVGQPTLVLKIGQRALALPLLIVLEGFELSGKRGDALGRLRADLIVGCFP